MFPRLSEADGERAITYAAEDEAPLLSFFVFFFQLTSQLWLLVGHFQNRPRCSSAVQPALTLKQKVSGDPLR